MSRAALFVASSLVSLALLEAAVRLFDIGPEIGLVHRENFRLSEDPVLRYELVPGSPDGEHTINARGMRDRERRLQKPEGVVRIAVLGDSIAYGHHLPREQTLAAILEDLLNREVVGAERTYEVLNFGVTGYGIEQAVHSLRARALSFDPDIAIYLYCLNDPEKSSLEMQNLLAAATGAERGYLERSARSNLRSYALARYLLDSMTREGRRSGESVDWRGDPQLAALAGGRHGPYFQHLYARAEPRARLEAGFGELARLSRRHGFRSLIVVFPVFGALEDQSLQGVHAQVAAAADARSLDRVDLAPLFAALPANQRQRFVLDSLHPTGKGNRLAAVATLSALLERGWIPGAGPDALGRLAAGGDRAARLARLVEQRRAGR